MDNMENWVREYIAYWEMDLRERKLWDGARLDSNFRAALEQALQGLAPARALAVPQVEPPDDKPE